MRVVLDTNVIVSGLAKPAALPGQLLIAWRKRQFELLCCNEQLAEIRSVTRYARVAKLVPAPRVGRMINQLKIGAELITKLPALDVSPDPFDNYLLALAQKGAANFLVTGDKDDLLALGKHGTTRIVSVREFAARIDR